MSDELEYFILEDGTKVAAGNLESPPGEHLTLFAEYPESMYLENKDIEKLLSGDFYKQERKRFQKWVINQSSVGKCATSATVGGKYQIEANDGIPHVPLADNWIYANVNGGKDQGSMLDRNMDFIQNKGVPPRVFQVDGKDYRIGDLVYNLNQIPASARAEAVKLAAERKAFEAFRVPREWSAFVKTVASAMARRHPIVMAMHVGQSFTRLKNGYVNPSRGFGNHAMLAQSAKWVGGETLVHPCIRNSWGPTQDSIYGPRSGGWGDGGFGLCTMEQLFACIKYHDYYVLTSSRQAPHIGVAA